MPGTCLSDPEEREAVILFADIVDSTAMAEELSLRAYGKVIWELQQIAEHVGSGFSKVCACPGSIASTRGDEICLTFHSQPGQTAQLQRNVQLALQSAVNLKLMWLVSDYNRERIKQDHLPRDLAIGVHLGQILHGRFPATAPRKSSEGFAFSVAKRIESAARAGRVSRVYLSDPIVHPLRQQCKDLQWDMPALSARGPLDQAKGLPAGRYNVHELDGIGDVPFSNADSGLGLEIDPTIFAICERIGLAHPNERWLCWLVAMLCRQQAGQTRWSDPPNTTTVLSSGQVSDRPETLDRKVSKGCESTGFEETCRSGERRGQETLAEHSRPVRLAGQTRLTTICQPSGTAMPPRSSRPGGGCGTTGGNSTCSDRTATLSKRSAS